jgi:hypothetical protein
MDQPTAQEVCARPPAAPQVGIFYVIEGALYLECTPVLEAEAYGDFQTHPTGHVEWWPGLVRRLNIWPPQSYDYYPRGRVNYARPAARFRLYLDRCLLNERSMIQAIIQSLHLADQAVELCTDKHYQ